MPKYEVSEPLDIEAKRLDKLEPNSKPQSTFLSLPDDIFEAGYGGPAGPGKTFSILTLPLFRGCHNIRGFYGKIWRRSFPQIQESLLVEANKWYPRFGYTYNGQDHTWTNKATKSQIAFGFLDADKDALKHDSAQFHYLGFDECTQFTKFMYQYMLHRCRSDISGWAAISRNSATPGDIGNTWYRKHFVEPAPEGFRVIEGIFKDKIVRRMFIRAHRSDNVALLENDPHYYDRLEMLPNEALRKAKLYGDFWAFQGQVFEEFRNYHMEGEPEWAVHVIPKVPIPDWWPKIVAIDWGYRHPNYVIWGAVSPKGRLIIYREYLCYKTPIKEWTANALKMSQFDGNIVRYVIDPATKGHHGDEKSTKEQIIAATGWPIEDADNDRIGGKQLVHELLRWLPRSKRFEETDGFDPDLAQQIFRLKGTEAYRQYVNRYMPDVNVETLPKIQIFDTNPALIESIQACIYDEGEGNNRTRAEDVKKQDGDDPYDGLRYLAKAWEAFLAGVTNEWHKRSEVEEAIASYKETGDYMTMDNRMSILEKKYEMNPIPIRYPRLRSHRRVITRR